MTRPNAVCRDLRQWLDYLHGNRRLAVARPDVALEFELAAIAKHLEAEKAVLFPAPGGHEIPVVANLLADRSWVADALGTTEADVVARYRDAVQNPLKPRDAAEAPVQEVVHDEVDLTRMLPIPTHNELDSGAYISAGLFITRNPTTGVQNVSIHRCQISGPDRIGVLLLPRHAHTFARRAEEAGEPLEVAIVIGIDPATVLASQAIVPIDFDEMEIAGALHGRPVDVVKCLTNNVRVPALAEIVLEGRVLADVREPEGPFGEFPQYYGHRADRHVIQIDKITQRRDAIFHTITGGGIEHLLLGGLPREASLVSHLQGIFPEVLDARLSQGGVCRYHLVVQIDKKQPGQAKNILLGAFSGHYDIKQVIVVDDDVNIHDPTDVEWAVATRFQADRDLLIIPDAEGSKLDPSTTDGLGAKMGLDATKPLDADPFDYQRISVPGEAGVSLGRDLQGEDQVQAYVKGIAGEV